MIFKLKHKCIWNHDIYVNKRKELGWKSCFFFKICINIQLIISTILTILNTRKESFNNNLNETESL